MKVILQKLGHAETVAEICIDAFPFVIGRRKDSGAQLSFAFISRRHCQFVRQDDCVLVQDLESYNGTFVNGKRASVPLLVQDGDEISLGPLSFRVTIQRLLQDTGKLVSTRSTEEMQRLDPAIE
jgi:pSer/pThr/pTyr-binding forkhead associated (FHA) protein